MDWWWRQQLNDEGLAVLIHEQHSVVSRAQLLAAGLPDVDVRRRVRSRRWKPVHPGVYVTHTGPVGYDERLVAALLYAGPEAAWSHYTAAEQFGLIKPDDRRPVYLTIPWRRRVRARPNLVITRDAHWEDRLAAVIPPRSRPAEAVLEIVGISRSLDDAAAVVAEACQSGRVAPEQILAALTGRPQLRHRAALRSILVDVAEGTHSLLELRYLRDVERAHGLPAGQRQRAVDGEYTDVAYVPYEFVVELDGRFHFAPRQRWRDLDRDNRAALRSEATLRYGWLDITSRPCAAAVQVLQLMRRKERSVTAHPCNPSCPVS
ncbi:type IV toxin-antitoxin system AbiEi family antitoxin domain-containing protein [Kribbella sp. NPDC055110]